MITIHDPVHGTIEVSPREIKLIDSQPFQRLRHIKQLGFAELAFPGATHSRYAHSLGAMHMATRMVERVFVGQDLPAHEKTRLCQSTRLAMLFHDLGHPPFGHISERIMPKVSELGIDDWANDKSRQATHEDYTVKLLLDSELGDLISQHFMDDGITSARLAALILGRSPPGDEKAYVVGGINWLWPLHQIVSSELDADRMDYLRRDAYYCGVSYGNFDHVWLTNNLTAVPYEDDMVLGLQHKAVWAFENFLLARLHMFLAVYYHHTSICFDHLLLRFYESGEYTLPGSSQAYLKTDDVHLTTHLRQSQNPWAQLIIHRRPYRLLLETHDFGDETSKEEEIDARLTKAGIDFFRAKSHGVLSKYFKKKDEIAPLLVIEPEISRIRRIEEYTPLYRRFQDVVAVSRVYCRPNALTEARRLLAGL